MRHTICHEPQTNRRTFLQEVALAASATQVQAEQTAPAPRPPPRPISLTRASSPGRQTKMIAFPLGGVAAGAISLGGRGQLRDWEIFNRPDKGSAPILRLSRHLGTGRQRQAGGARAGSAHPAALRRIERARLEQRAGPGAARIGDLHRRVSRWPASISRIAPCPCVCRWKPSRPFIPHEPDDSGLPVAILRYRVTNPGAAAAKVSIAWSIDNPVRRAPGDDTRVNEHRESRTRHWRAARCAIPTCRRQRSAEGQFRAVRCSTPGGDHVTHLRGWERGRWWNSPMLFWDDFTADGELGPEPAARNAVGALCLQRTIAPGAHARFHVPARLAFSESHAARAAAGPRPRATKTRSSAITTARVSPTRGRRPNTPRRISTALEKQTRRFAAALRESTLPAAVKDAATRQSLHARHAPPVSAPPTASSTASKASTIKAGCCHGNCTHVWNYETATPHLFPSFARSLRGAAFGYRLDDAGAMRFRQLLPDGKERSGFAAADGQMGQIMHAYLDWRSPATRTGCADSGRASRRRSSSPGFRAAGTPTATACSKACSTTPTTWSSTGRTRCAASTIWARCAPARRWRAPWATTRRAAEYRRLFESGRNGSTPTCSTASTTSRRSAACRRTRSRHRCAATWAPTTPENPQYQVGGGCLVDQLVGQYMAEVAGLGRWSRRRNIRKTLESIYRYNYKRTLAEHDTVQRTFALNDEAALVVCDYGKADAPADSLPVLRRSVDRPRVLGRRAHDVRGHDARGRRVHHAMRARATTARSAIPGTRPDAAITMRAPWRHGRRCWR